MKKKLTIFVIFLIVTVICLTIFLGVYKAYFKKQSNDYIKKTIILNTNFSNRPTEPILSKTDYRIFACGEEIFFEPDQESLSKKRSGLFTRSESGSIIADGMPSSYDDVLMTSFFDAAGGTLQYLDHKDIFRIPTKNGIREFYSGDLCNGKEAKLHVLHHRIETSTKPWSVFSRILYKYWDLSLKNNYGEVPPGNCLIFIFDSDEVLEKPWPTCAAHDKALAEGELILEY